MWASSRSWLFSDNISTSFASKQIRRTDLVWEADPINYHSETRQC